MTERDRLYLGHIQICIERIEEYTTQGHDHFMASHQAQDDLNSKRQ